MCNGKIFNIQRFCTEDGPGIRTTVFLKGCPLNCIWCHNPESRSFQRELLFNSEKCIGCRACAEVCKNHSFESGKHSFGKDICADCGKCALVCPADALEICGKRSSVTEITETVLKDLEFYKNSGGGVTISGGEPLFQPAFSLALLKEFKKHKLHTAVETCGYFSGDISLFAPYVDLWLFDIKLFGEEKHKKYTGVSNIPIIKNLRLLDSFGANIILRCPIIPDINLNEEHFKNISALANSLGSVSEINLLPYHPLGISKSEQLGKESSYPNKDFLSADEISPYLPLINTSVMVKIL